MTIIHTLRFIQRLPFTREEVFAFFAEACNLERITPPELRFQIITPAPITMQLGNLIQYRLRLLGIPFTWLTRICCWRPPGEFVDEQLHGPYRLWVHTHRFYPGEGGTVMEDEIRYCLPFFPLGEAAYPLVKWQLQRIFAFRRQAIIALLSRNS